MTYIKTVPFSDSLQAISQIQSNLESNDIENYIDAVGTKNFENSVLEYFGGEIIKAVNPESGKYTGGKKMTMTITSIKDDPNRLKYLQLVQAHSKPLMEIGGMVSK